MSTEYFVDEKSIVRQIWGKSDTILFIFAGASAEFALNKAVDWLYFTGRLPADPIGRLFSTVSYARHIVFSENQKANHAIKAITDIHSEVERKRGYKIPDWAYRDVLFMLIDYSIRSFELLERKLSLNEKHEVFNVFYRVGNGMRIPDLPLSFEDWERKRISHMNQNLERSTYSDDLFDRYRKHLGVFRYRLLLEAQKLLVPQKVHALLGFNRVQYLKPMIALYKFSRQLKIDGFLKAILLPSNYKANIKALDYVSSERSHQFNTVLK